MRTMFVSGLLAALVLAFSIVPNAVSAATLAAPVQITISPSSATLSPGQTRQEKAIATYPDGSTRDVTHELRWSSSDPAVATVSSAGLISVIGHGTTMISADDGDFALEFGIMCAPFQYSLRDPYGLQISSIEKLGVGRVYQLEAFHIYASGNGETEENITGQTEGCWAPSNGNVLLSSDTPGLITGKQVGPVQMTLHWHGMAVSGGTIQVIPETVASPYRDNATVMETNAVAGSTASYTYTDEIETATLWPVTGLVLSSGGAADFSGLEKGYQVPMSFDHAHSFASLVEATKNSVTLHFDQSLHIVSGDVVRFELPGKNTTPGQYFANFQWLIGGKPQNVSRHMPIVLTDTVTAKGSTTALTKPISMAAPKAENSFLELYLLILLSISSRLYSLIRLHRHDRTV